VAQHFILSEAATTTLPERRRPHVGFHDQVINGVFPGHTRKVSSPRTLRQQSPVAVITMVTVGPGIVFPGDYVEKKWFDLIRGR
jgi:hypothetical protein